MKVKRQTRLQRKKQQRRQRTRRHRTNRKQKGGASVMPNINPSFDTPIALKSDTTTTTENPNP